MKLGWIKTETYAIKLKMKVKNILFIKSMEDSVNTSDNKKTIMTTLKNISNENAKIAKNGYIVLNFPDKKQQY